MSVDNCETYLEIRNRLSDIEVQPLVRYTGGLSKRVYPHQCFDKAFDFMKRNSDLVGAMYVEGIYTNLNLDHAWVEIGGVVFDGTMQRFYDKSLYYKKQLAVKIVEYDYKGM
ncbi:MAG: hypothetical protein E6540_13255, partial [Enterococcus sp.]|nr:hypothetical protein [Enterococcus sp.]